MNGLPRTVPGLAFRVLMETVGRDRLPYPIQFQPVADSAAEYHRQRTDAANIVSEVLDDELHSALAVLVRPRVRIEVVGHRRAGGRIVKIRAHASIGDDRAVVLTQPPGAVDHSGGDVTIDVVDPHHAVGRALSTLPDVDRGRHPRIDIDRPSDPSDATGEFVASVAPTTRAEQFHRLFSRPRSSAGEVLVCPGPATDSRPSRDAAVVRWADLPGDGRYAIREASVVSVMPVSTQDLAAEIGALVARVSTN